MLSTRDLARQLTELETIAGKVGRQLDGQDYSPLVLARSAVRLDKLRAELVKVAEWLNEPKPKK